MRKTNCATFGLLIALVFAGGSSSYADSFRTVALTGDPAPGTSASTAFHFLGEPVINNAGQTAFTALLTGSNAGNGGVWSEGQGNLELVARRGDLAAGTQSGETFDTFSDLNINENGRTAFRGLLSGPAVSANNNRGIWSQSTQGLSLVARTGEVAPGVTPGATYTFLGPHVYNDANQSAFSARVTTTDESDDGIWSNSGGGLALVARSKATLGYGMPIALNSAGTIAYMTSSPDSITNPYIGDSETAIWLANGGVSSRVVGRPDSVLGFDFYYFSNNPSLNAAGQTAFAASESGVTARGLDGVFLNDGSSALSLLAYEGSPTPDGGEFDVFFEPVINANGQVAFGAGISFGSRFTTEIGIWSGELGSLSSVAQSGTNVPGVPVGIGFDQLGFSDIVLNGAGQTAFAGKLSGSGIDQQNDAGIWAQDRNGNLKLIARKGDPFDVDDGPGTDLRTILHLSFVGGAGKNAVVPLGTGNEDGRPSSFNDAGQVVFSALFTDGTSGVFVSNLATVPEPSTTVLVAMTVLGFLGFLPNRRTREI